MTPGERKWNRFVSIMCEAREAWDDLRDESLHGSNESFGKAAKFYALPFTQGTYELALESYIITVLLEGGEEALLIEEEEKEPRDVL